MIEKQRFVNYKTQEEQANDESTVISLRLNNREWEIMRDAKKLLSQPKNTTALKILVEIGYYVLQEPKTRFIIETVFKNKLNNSKIGILEKDIN